jgi:hypothetical protein
MVVAILCPTLVWALDLMNPQGEFVRPGVDSAVRIGYLQARQTVRYNEANISYAAGAVFDRFRMDYGPRVPLVSGMVELTPIRFASARGAAASSVFETGMQVFHTRDDPTPALWDLAPNYKCWEAAGLFHLWSGDGYRFSLAGGFRKDYWTYQGPLVATDSGDSWASDRLTADIPFLAMQTSMSFPWWKARCEILGSPFMTKRISTQFRTGSTLVEYEGVANKGGLLEATLEGSVGVTDRFRVGAYGRYTYEELYGQSTRKAGATISGHEIFLYETTAIGGINFEAVF